MAADSSKVIVSPVWVSYNGVVLGFTKGGTTVSRKLTTVPITIQGVEKAIAIVKKEVTAQVLLAETVYERLQTLLALDKDQGDDLMAIKHTLTLINIHDYSDVTTIPSAFVTGDTEVPFTFDKERVWPVMFRAIYTAGDMSFTTPVGGPPSDVDQGPLPVIPETVTYEAAVALGGQRVVIVDDDHKINYADNTNSDHVDRVLGITMGAISEDSTGTVLTEGVMTEPSWNWIMNRGIYLGTNGLLTQTVPTTPSAYFALEVGFPLSIASMFVRIGMPIILA